MVNLATMEQHFFTYATNGLRTQRTVGDSKTYRYVYDGSQLKQMTVGNDTLYFTYDASGTPMSVTYNGTTFYYATNLQGDVVAILGNTGTAVVTYTYDAWGNLLNTSGRLAPTLGTLNPLRYRGYVYDEETGLYYLQSRYYNPEWGRFISADIPDVLTASPMSLTDKNLFAYCDNNPVTREDSDGAFWDTVFDVVSLVASVVEVCVNPTDSLAWAGLAGDAVDLIPFVTGVGETVRAAKAIDKATDTLQIAKAVDFTDEANDIVRSLDRSSGFTKSTARDGIRIHQGYKVGDGFNPEWKEYKKIKGIRPDYIDFDNNIIYELKPMNPRSIRSGIRQLEKYNKALGGGFTMRLEWY